MKVNENGRNVLIFGRSSTSTSQNFDVLSTFCGRKYGRLDVIQNPAYSPAARHQRHLFGAHCA